MAAIKNHELVDDERFMGPVPGLRYCLEVHQSTLKTSWFIVLSLDSILLGPQVGTAHDCGSTKIILVYNFKK